MLKTLTPCMRKCNSQNKHKIIKRKKIKNNDNDCFMLTKTLDQSISLNNQTPKFGLNYEQQSKNKNLKTITSYNYYKYKQPNNFLDFISKNNNKNSISKSNKRSKTTNKMRQQKKIIGRNRNSFNIIDYLSREKYNTLQEISDMGNFLKTKEKEFMDQINCQKIINLEKNKQLLINVNSLEKTIKDKYADLSKSKSNFYNENKKIIKTIYDNKFLTIENNVNEKIINDLRNTINDIYNKMNQIERVTDFYKNEYTIINNQINCFKNKIKILPEIINSTEEENKNILKAQINIHNKIQDIKSQIYKFDKNRKNIGRIFKQANLIYKNNNII